MINWIRSYFAYPTEEEIQEMWRDGCFADLEEKVLGDIAARELIEGLKREALKDE